ncbi:MAG: hypothetical protein ABIO06_07160 [Pseudolysinimonas sp.]
MSTWRALATASAAALLLSGCAPAATPTAHPSAPTPTASHPAFLDSPQTDVDLLPGGISDSIRVDPNSSRIQGAWDSRQVFLAIRGANTVCLVTGIPGKDSSWRAGCGGGDGIVTDELPDGATVKYLPMVTKAAPEGWTRLSDYVFAM